jgi:hypothetical protein
LISRYNRLIECTYLLERTEFVPVSVNVVDMMLMSTQLQIYSTFKRGGKTDKEAEKEKGTGERRRRGAE